MTKRRPRFLNRWYANLLGYFWLECPNCHQPFGGHEAGTTTTGERINCWRCDP